MLGPIWLAIRGVCLLRRGGEGARKKAGVDGLWWDEGEGIWIAWV